MAATYPRSVELAGEEIRLRLMEPQDAATVQEFCLSLPVEDLLFLQRDVTDSHEIDAWAAEIAKGDAVTLIAEADGELLGEATLRQSRVSWTRHVASVRVITQAQQRGRGLGHLLLEEIFTVAAERGVEKIVAEMTVEQVSAIGLFEQLGFHEEGHYHGYVKDRRGRPHDLIVMTRDQPSLHAARPNTEQELTAWRCGACGHVTTSDEAPPRCPDCGASSENFSQVQDSL